MKILNIEVEGMNCGGCVNKITNHFEVLEEIEKIQVDLGSQTIKIIADEDLSSMKVRNDLIELGFSVNSIKKV